MSHLMRSPSVNDRTILAHHQHKRDLHRTKECIRSRINPTMAARVTPSMPRMVAGSDFHVPGPHQRWIAFSHPRSRALSLTVPALLSTEMAMKTTFPAHSAARRRMISWDACIDACRHSSRPLLLDEVLCAVDTLGKGKSPRMDPTRLPRSQSLTPVHAHAASLRLQSIVDVPDGGAATLGVSTARAVSTQTQPAIADLIREGFVRQ